MTNKIDPNQSIDLAIDLIYKGDLPQAELIFKSLLKEYPNNKLINFLRNLVIGADNANKNGSFQEKKILKSFLNDVSHYFSVPEYNINWSSINIELFSDYLSDNTINLVDVGARNGYLGEIETLKKFINYIGFDADSAETNRLNLNPPNGFKSFKIFPYFIGSNAENVDFNIFNSPGDSSIYKPSKSFKDKYNSKFDIKKTIKLKSKSLEDALKVTDVNFVNFLKLDTQGSELDILKNSPNLIKNVPLIESEIELIEIYENQPLFGDFFNFMKDNGYYILYINRIFQNRKSYNGPARGIHTFCDVLFSKNDEFINSLDIKHKIIHIILMCIYGHLDIAFDLFMNDKNINLQAPGIKNIFMQYDANTKNYVKIHDKLLYWQLHMRKTNQLPFDSDRSWPFR